MGRLFPNYSTFGYGLRILAAFINSMMLASLTFPNKRYRLPR